METKRILYLDYLRIIATIAVILIHTASQNWHEFAPDTVTWNTLNLFDSAARFAVPLFCMISGVLFLNPEKEVSVRKLYAVHIRRMVTAFLFWSLFYAVIYKVRYHWSFEQFLYSFLSGSYHLWFLYMIIGFYVSVPVLRKITESRKLTEYFLIITLVYTFLVPILFRLPYVSSLRDAFYENTHFYLTLGYTGYFVLGYWLANIELNKSMRIVCYVIGILGFAVTAGFTRLVSLWSGELIETFYEPVSLNVLMEATGVFVFGKYVLSRWEPKETVRAWVIKLADCTFGVYLVHIIVLDFLHKIGLTTVTFNSAFSVILIVFLTAVISFGISYVMNRIPFVKKTIV